MYYKFQRVVEDENNKTLAMARQMKVTAANDIFLQNEPNLFGFVTPKNQQRHRVIFHGEHCALLDQSSDRSIKASGEFDDGRGRVTTGHIEEETWKRWTI